MKPCLHPSIVTSESLEGYLDIAKRSGYRVVDVDFRWIAERVQARGLGYVRDLFETSGIELASFGLPVDVYGDEAHFQATLQDLVQVAETALCLGATRAVTWLWPSVDERPIPYGSRLARRLRACADALSAFGIRLGLEFVGPHHLRGKRYPFVLDLNDLRAYLEAIGSPSAGILLDSYHWYTAELSVEDILALKAHEIAHVHINDATLPPHEAHDQERCLPGDGQIDLLGFVSALDRIGYTGPLSLEVLHKAPLEGSDEGIARRMHDTLTRLITNAREESIHRG
ncbi:sugar phosphate isomerase/epimerase [Alicyclobacillus fastidiosus]|uniref:Sugar phosphate isomerase/epimerase n=1 Tax=Alicyclobacillus fastidiosus TaxID=392011 RepID=A0ABY6ZKY2_9BACL|nr:sugar phosphate isomerase/epimerase family protein [Alicyclobacillus fastidiosus]WAH43594.1 sugar phosphate isomerase/epimerase [Alicyclobacillus fastidiosus]GMA59777.1 sugar phosphate isomerase [Alicyclobacillus fastidiosus]